MNENIFDFIGGKTGDWKITKATTLIGDSLPKVTHVDKIQSCLINRFEGDWSLKGVISNMRYTDKYEKEKMDAKQEKLGRKKATHAAFIPIRKSQAWWDLAQDERRHIIENQSKHMQHGMKYLPAIARQLYHSRDINEPFDFLTWFEFAPEDEPAFNELLSIMRKSEEWKYVEREIDIRMVRV
ncbi:chlorite dismutase family protein [Flavobacterium algicola]|uniref:chlorite dismutase family protein n=1 Tax=Flavobacterium algicola TaxID=556529 RepID=UPI001EFC3E19|nr:chlorite dismutase family protein [Flavobacterium algicola]MCG9793435.1 chlorite dismutase family protein [Flavobacterium algicola]